MTHTWTDCHQRMSPYFPDGTRLRTGGGSARENVKYDVGRTRRPSKSHGVRTRTDTCEAGLGRRGRECPPDVLRGCVTDVSIVRSVSRQWTMEWTSDGRRDLTVRKSLLSTEDRNVCPRDGSETWIDYETLRQ